MGFTKKKFFITTCAAIIILFIAIYTGIYPIYRMKKNGRFTIGRVYPVIDGTIRLTFMYKGIEQKRDYG